MTLVPDGLLSKAMRRPSGDHVHFRMPAPPSSFAFPPMPAPPSSFGSPPAMSKTRRPPSGEKAAMDEPSGDHAGPSQPPSPWGLEYWPMGVRPDPSAATTYIWAMRPG